MWLANAEKYQQEYEAADAALIKARRDAKAEGGIYVDPQPKVALVMRVKGIHKIDPKSRKILQLLRLKQINNAVFVKLNKATLNMIRKVEPFITYGYPSRGTIKALIYKRGFVKSNKQRIPISDNQVIEDNLGKSGIVCVEDLIHSIVTVDSNFKQANNFLWPFKLNNPKGGWEAKKTPYVQGGTWGNREQHINELVKAML